MHKTKSKKRISFSFDCCCQSHVLTINNGCMKKTLFSAFFSSVFVSRNVKTSVQLDIFLSRLWLGSQLRQIQWTPTYLFKKLHACYSTCLVQMTRSLSLSSVCFVSFVVFRFVIVFVIVTLVFVCVSLFLPWYCPIWCVVCKNFQPEILTGRVILVCLHDTRRKQTNQQWEREMKKTAYVNK